MMNQLFDLMAFGVGRELFEERTEEGVLILDPIATEYRVLCTVPLPFVGGPGVPLDTCAGWLAERFGRLAGGSVPDRNLVTPSENRIPPARPSNRATRWIWRVEPV